jgi:SAM-dependent methyltransferase
MVKRGVFSKIGNYDEDYFIPYEDSDFSIRARKAGFGLYCNSKAKTYHQGLKTTYVHPWVEWLGITSAERAYRVARNKIIFMRKHSPFPANIFFFFVMLPSYAAIHSLIILFTARFDILAKYWLGLASGIGYAVFFPLLGVRKAYSNLDAKSLPVKMFLMAWTDPVPMVVRKDVSSILDLGCGDGKSMAMIKSRRQINQAVGVDIFAPDLELAKKRGVHDKYLLQDVRKVNFPKKSFDLVLSSHVIEHLPQKDATSFIKSMESMARKQVIIATPIGETYHPAVGGNVYQIHLSSFTPEDFHKIGYKTVNYGWKWLLGEEGLVHTVRNDMVRKLLYFINILATPVYYLFPSTCDYVFVAYKNITNEE